MLDYITGLAGFAFFVSISLATRQHFRSERYPWGMYVISALSLVGTVTFLAFAAQRELILAGLSLVLILAAQALFAWAVKHSRETGLSLAFDNQRQSDGIIRTGPWQHMRHPFYASYIMFWLACAVATQHIISVIVFLTLTAIYSYSAVLEERALSAGPLRKEYKAYRDTVGFFYPRLPIRG